MALLHRDRTTTATDDTVAGPTTEPTRRPVHASDDRPVVVRKGSVGSTIKTVLATLLLVAVVLVAAANTGDVDVDLLLEEYRVSLALLVGGSAVAGLLIGLLMGRRSGRRVA